MADFNGAPSDLLEKGRNSFGFRYPNNVKILGTKGDVHTFFWVLHDLIATGILADNYMTITHDLYRTLVNHENFEAFKEEVPQLKSALGEIKSDNITWEDYPFNRNKGTFDYQNCRIDPTRETLADVFQSFFSTLEKVPFWIQRYLDRGNIKHNRLYVSPAEIITGLKFKKYSTQDFLDAVDDPLWLREPGDRKYKYPFPPVIQSAQS